ncbi:MAG: sulfur carrier protein ThiS [Deltaproteobacteria bacterium]|nr:sulfur carrier protein ThiS [Deltaproteobacteria bacterium]
MISVNGDPIDYEGSTTVTALLERLKFVFPLLIVRINGTVIDREKYDHVQVVDEDEVEIIHMMCGG